jgi:flagellar hook-basal body complex protein FliE
MPIDPTMAVNGAEWNIAPVEGQTGPAAGGAQPVDGAGGFGGMLSQQISNLQKTQTDAATASQELATGQTDDVASVVSSVERARLSMELASTLRTKAVDAYQEIFRTQV